jgi:hypothetical protein
MTDVIHHFSGCIVLPTDRWHDFASSCKHIRISGGLSVNVTYMKNSMMLKSVVTTVLLLMMTTFSFAQIDYAFERPYQTALGVRVGGTSGVSIKHFYSSSMAFEGLIGVFGNGFSLTGLVEKHRNAFDAVGLNWYYGAGAHLAFYNGNAYYRVGGREVNDRDNQDIAFGVNGIIGLEYSLPDNIPVAFSFDFKPFVEIDNDGEVGVAPDLALGIKFLIR